MSIIRQYKKFFILFIAILFLSGGGKLFLDAIYVPVIIMYHSVGDEDTTLDGYGPKLNVFPEAFAKQIKFLYDNNYKVIPLTEFIERMKNGEKIPHKTLAITFDDGLKNILINAYPVLKRYNFPATVFIATDFAGKEKFLNWDEIKMLQQNNITIGSHTMSHTWLLDLGEELIKKELEGSKKILESMTGENIEVLSYPLGGHDEKVKRMAKKVGYVGAVTTSPGKSYPDDDIYAIKRIRISMTSDNLFIFWLETSGFYTFIKEIRDED